MPYPAAFQLAQSTRLYNFSLSELHSTQRQDTTLSKVIYALEYGEDSTLPHVPVPLSAFILKEDISYCTGTIGKNKVTQLVIPNSLVETTLKLLHDARSAGHPGRDKTSSVARAKYYWPTLRLDIKKHIAQCLSCVETQGTTKTASILEYPLPSGPFDVIGIDLFHLPLSHHGSPYVLVCVDYFSRFTVLLRQRLMPLSLTSSAPTRLLVFS